MEKRQHPKYDLKELLAKITPENRHPLILDDTPIGKEFPNGHEDEDGSDLLPAPIKEGRGR